MEFITSPDATLQTKTNFQKIGYTLRHSNLDFNNILPNDCEENMLINTMKDSLDFFSAHNLHFGIAAEENPDLRNDKLYRPHYENMVLLRSWAKLFMEGEKNIEENK